MLTRRRIVWVVLSGLAAVCWIGRPGIESLEGPATESAPRDRPVNEKFKPEAIDSAPLHSAKPRLPPHEDPAPPSHLLANVTRKYELLLEQFPSVDAQRLQQLLIARESVNAADFIQVAERERELSLFLRPEEYALYEQLRESDDTQAHVHRFTEHVRETSPLHPQQQRALILAKLKHAAALQMLDAELERVDRPSMEGAYARDVATQGLDHHQRAFLEDVRPDLTAEQWLSLTKFEQATLHETLSRPRQ